MSSEKVSAVVDAYVAEINRPGRRSFSDSDAQLLLKHATLKQLPKRDLPQVLSVLRSKRYFTISQALSQGTNRFAIHRAVEDYLMDVGIEGNIERLDHFSKKHEIPRNVLKNTLGYFRVKVTGSRAGEEPVVPESVRQVGKPASEQRRQQRE